MTAWPSERLAKAAPLLRSVNGDERTAALRGVVLILEDVGLGDAAELMREVYRAGRSDARQERLGSPRTWSAAIGSIARQLRDRLAKILQDHGIDPYAN
jgi:hypothetical protein